MENITFDPAIYGGQSPTGNTFNPVPVPDVRGVTESQPAVPAPDSVAYAEAVSKGSMSQLIGQASLAAAGRAPATAKESAKASVKTWSTTHMIEAMNAPTFTPDSDYDTNAFMKQVPFTPTEGEDKVLRSASSWDEAKYKLGLIQEQRENYTIMGDNMGTSMLVGAVDPIYIGLDILTLGAGRLAGAAGAGVRAQRILAAGGAAAGAAAIGAVEQSQVGISDNQIIGMALLNGAASAVAYRAGKMVPKDPSFPSADLTRAASGLGETAEVAAARAVREEATQIVPRRSAGEAVPVHVQEGTLGDLKLPAKPGTRTGADLLTDALDDPNFADLAKRLQDVSGDLPAGIEVRQGTKANLIEGNRPYYSLADHIIVSNKNMTTENAVHEVVHGLTSHKLEYGLANLDSAHGKIVKELETLRTAAKSEAQKLGIAEERLTKYFNDDLHEFVAGLYSRDNEFVNMLAKMPSGKSSILREAVDVVRRLLGLPTESTKALGRAMGLTEDLIKTPLNVELKEAGIGIRSAPPTGTPGQQAAQIIKDESRASRAGKGIEWSLSKTMGRYSEEARKTTRLLVDDPVDMTADSVVSQHRAVRADMAMHQYAYHDVLLEAMKEQGFGTLRRISNSAEGAAAQARIEADVAKELLRREGFLSRGIAVPEDATVSATTKKLADTYGNATQFALREQKAAGVAGAETVKDNAGYFTRSWANDKIERITSALEGAGMDAKAASKSVKDALTKGILARNNWEAELAGDVAGAILDRARRKGYGEDITAMGRAGADTAKEVERILREAGVSGSRFERAMDVLTGAVDEAGKSAQLKHRVDIDMSIPINTPTGNFTLLDLIDTDMTRLLDKYLDGAAANTAFARKGLVSATDVNNLRTVTAKSIAKESDRKEFLKLFDDTVDTIRGMPAGDNVPAGMRKLSAVTQMVALSASALWQVTEYATAMSRFGIMKTTGMAMKELPGFRSLLGSISKDKGQAEHLANILSRNSSQDIRIQPYIRRMEDNFDVPMSDTVMMSLQNAKQLVPYINGMRYIHHHQANMVGNLVADAFHRAAKGDAKAIEVMEKYGMKPHTIANIKDDILKNGMDTAKWSDRTWAEVRGPLTKMMDESVLRNRLGEIPAFAQFTSVGKFVFTFRSFVLGAHNKILAGTLGREGAAGLGLLLMYQYPLTYAATLANETMSGRTGQKTPEQIAGAAMSQMGSIGLFGEVAGIAFGNKQQFGAPGLIPIDRVYKAGSAVASGQFGQAASGALDTVPILSIIPFHKALTDIPKGE